MTSAAGGPDAFARRQECDEEKDDADSAHNAIVICQPFALSPCPNLATSGNVNPPTINCAIIAATKRYDDSDVRSFTSPVITPVSAEYGVLLAE